MVFYKQEGVYRDDKREGIFVYYDTNARKVQQREFSNGVLIE